MNFPPQLVYLPLLFLGLRFPSRRLALACAALFTLAGLLLWLRSLARGRAVLDTPRARIATAAQGYVELHGKLKPFGNFALSTPGGGFPCVWFRSHVEERRGDEWQTVSRNNSEESLVLADASGECLIFWEGAEMLGTRSRVWYQDQQRITDHWLNVGEEVTVLGDLRTRGGGDGAPSLEGEIRDLLADWKANRSLLLARYDRNRDGEIDVEEWEQARRDARREVLHRRSTQPEHEDTHVIGRPTDGRPFIVSALAGGALRRHYLLLGTLDLTAFFGGLWWLSWTLRHGSPFGLF
jgi:hypothetical protein